MKIIKARDSKFDMVIADRILRLSVDPLCAICIRFLCYIYLKKKIMSIFFSSDFVQIMSDTIFYDYKTALLAF